MTTTVLCYIIKVWERIFAFRRSENEYECPCGYVYDPELGDPDNGVAPGTAWEDVPEDWLCPTCGLGKDSFYPVD